MKMPHTIHHEIRIAASPEKVYRALLDEKEFSARTGGAPTSIDAKEGGAFSCFGGHVTGRNIELRPNACIVQAWRAKTWSEGHYSVARFELRSDAQGTLLVFDHAGFPEGTFEHLEQGWRDNYWTPLERSMQ
jgi:activator of HSP90 ATPase